MPGTRKAKHFLIAAIKLLVVGGAFYFIWSRLAHDEKLDWQLLFKALNQAHASWLSIGLLMLTFLNRFLEILKWHTLAQTLKPLSLRQAAAQVLAAVTAALFTPNGIGEYAAKAMYFEKKQAKQVVFLNLVCNGVQLLLAVAGGIAGLAYFNSHYHTVPQQLLLGGLSLVAVVFLLIIGLRKIAIKGYSLQRIFAKVNSLPQPAHQKNLIFAMLRYAVLMHQYYLLFLLFDVTISYPLLMAAIAATYFVGSSLPSFQFLDFAVKGGVGVFFLGLMGVSEWIVVLVATLIWLLNTVLPVIVGSYFVLRFKAVAKAQPEG